MSGKPFRVLILCSGNTCRSPMAEGILKKALQDRGVDGVEVRSAGTLGLHDQPATATAVEVARSHGVDIAEHRSAAFTPEMGRQFDLILALADEHFELALAMGVPAEKVYMLKTYPRRTRDRRSASVRDPIGGSKDLYEDVFLEMDDAIQRSIGELIRQAGQNSGAEDET